jgi:hypothetical protein
MCVQNNWNWGQFPRFPAFQGHLSSENPLLIYNSYPFFGFLFYSPRFVGLFSVSLTLDIALFCSASPKKLNAIALTLMFRALGIGK